MPGDLAIGHNRYSTTGSSRLQCPAGGLDDPTRAFALAHNGNLVNAKELREAVDDGQVEFTDDGLGLIAFAVQQAVDRFDWRPGIEAALKLWKGPSVW